MMTQAVLLWEPAHLLERYFSKEKFGNEQQAECKKRKQELSKIQVKLPHAPLRKLQINMTALIVHYTTTLLLRRPSKHKNTLIAATAASSAMTTHDRKSLPRNCIQSPLHSNAACRFKASCSRRAFFFSKAASARTKRAPGKEPKEPALVACRDLATDS